MPNERVIPVSASPEPVRRPRSHKSRFLIAGLAFPTLLLVAAAVVAALLQPKVNLMVRLAATGNEVLIELPWAEKDAKWAAPKGWVERYLGTPRQLTLGKARDLSMEDIRQLATWDSLRVLTVVGSSDTPEELFVPLGDLTGVTTLVFWTASGTFAGTTTGWIGKLSTLEELQFYAMKDVRAADFRQLTRLHHLKKLRLEALTGANGLYQTTFIWLRDKDFQGMDPFPNLELLDLPSTLFVHDHTMVWIAQHPKLMTLSIDSAPDLKQSAFDELHRLTQLETLRIGQFPKEIHIGPGLRGLHKLKTVGDFQTLCADCARDLAQMQSLEKISFNHADEDSITNAALLKDSKSLRELDIPNFQHRTLLEELSEKLPGVQVSKIFRGTAP